MAVEVIPGPLKRTGPILRYCFTKPKFRSNPSPLQRNKMTKSRTRVSCGFPTWVIQNPGATMPAVLTPP